MERPKFGLLLFVGTVSLTFLRYKIGKGLVRVFSIVFLCSLMLSLPSRLQDSIMSRIANSGHTNDYRIEYIYDAIDLGSKFPLLGIGPGNYGKISASADYSTTIDPHNAYLQTFAEQGTFALLLVLLLYAFGTSRALRFRDSNNLSNLALSILACLFVDGVVSGLSLSSKYLYLFLALVGSGNTSPDRHSPSRVSSKTQTANGHS